MAETQYEQLQRSSPERSSSEPSSPRRKARFLPTVQVIGWTFVLLVLAGYFAWMVIEMGAHATTGPWPMVGVFAAAVTAGLAATLGLIAGRRSRG